MITLLVIFFIGVMFGAACAVLGFAWCIRSVYGYGGGDDE